MICSCGKRFHKLLTTVKPPTPESKTPMGCVFSNDVHLHSFFFFTAK
jgi:hypothetical protein